MWSAVVGIARSRHISALVILWVALMVSGTAAAVSFDLNTEFDTGVTGPYATVEISENDGALDFLISLNLDELGPAADLQTFYFNFADDFVGPAISDTNAPNTEYVLVADPEVTGGAGSSFDWAVEFGNGAGEMGNDTLQVASFTLSAFGDLSITHLLKMSSTAGGALQVQMAAHIQGTSLVTGASSETIGGVVPEPSTAVLVGLGIAVLAIVRRDTRRARA